MGSRLRRGLISVARLGMSLTLISFIVWKVDTVNPLDRLASLDWRGAVSAAALILIAFPLHAKRWLMALSARAYAWDFRSALREIWVGSFFNQLLPSSIGGDGIRALRLHGTGMPASTALRGVLAERVFGFIACTLLSIAAVPAMIVIAPTAPASIAVAGTVAVGIIGILVLWRPNSPLVGLLPRRLANEVRLLSAMVMDRRYRARMMVISIAMQFCIAGSVALLSWGLGIQVSPVLVALLFQPVTLLTLLPISLAGWGIREGALVAVLAAVGVPSTDALPLSLAFGALMFFASLPGCLFFAMGRVAGPRQHMPRDSSTARMS